VALRSTITKDETKTQGSASHMKHKGGIVRS
jgi:hypothetical protein